MSPRFFVQWGPVGAWAVACVVCIVIGSAGGAFWFAGLGVAWAFRSAIEADRWRRFHALMRANK